VFSCNLDWLLLVLDSGIGSSANVFDRSSVSAISIDRSMPMSTLADRFPARVAAICS
jgi:hypothetical protein